MKNFKKINIKDNQKNIKVSTKIPRNISFFVKPLAMKRAFNNILSNAFFYAEKYILITVKKNKNQGAIIIFEDDGPGVPKNKRSDVINPRIIVVPMLKKVEDTIAGIIKSIVNGLEIPPVKYNKAAS